MCIKRGQTPCILKQYDCLNNNNTVPDKLQNSIIVLYLLLSIDYCKTIEVTNYRRSVLSQTESG